MSIGHRSFRINRNVFSQPGDSPNFFTLGFGAFFGSDMSQPPSKQFIRPPPMAPPTVPNRSGELFGDLLAVLQGSPVKVKSEEHRLLLLKECRYYRLRNLEQRFIKHEMSVNRARGTKEITVNIEDVKIGELTFEQVRGGVHTVFYKRPFVDTISRELVLQIELEEQVALTKNAEGTWDATLYDSAAAYFSKIAKYLEERLGKKFSINKVVRINERRLPIMFDSETVLMVDGQLDAVLHGQHEDLDVSRKRARVDGPTELICERSQWRVVAEGDTTCLHLLTAECYSSQRYRNSQRKYI